jgi:GxxExxY protein
VLPWKFRERERLGSGFQENIYQRTLEKELRLENLKVEPGFELPIFYKGEKILLRRINFLIDGKVCIAIKALANLDDVHLAKAINYLEASGLEVGLLINLEAKSLQLKRLQKRDKNK